jgi:hypothetical protein
LPSASDVAGLQKQLNAIDRRLVEISKALDSIDDDDAGRR